MAGNYRRRAALFAISTSALVAVSIAIAAISEGSEAESRTNARTPLHIGTRIPDPPRITASLTVSRVTYGRPIAPGFVGLSLEYYGLTPYAGRDPRAVNPVLVQLIRNLAPGGSPVLRIGGDSTDWTGVAVRGLTPPPGVTFTLTRDWVAVLRSLAAATHARLILGINLEANLDWLAAAEGRTLSDGVGRRWIAAFEIGNEPELYGRFSWYRASPGHWVTGRLLSYSPLQFRQEFARIGGVLPRLPLAGPTIGGQNWIQTTAAFVASEPRVRIVTIHRYPLQRCFVPAASPSYPTIPHLLWPASSEGLAAGVASYAAIAHAHGLPLRVDELGSVSCGGKRGVSDTFASSLWVLDTLFAMAGAGVDGVNMHTFPQAAYAPFHFSRVHGSWRAFVTPEYYGLLMFARGAPPGSRLLRLASGAGAWLRAWATEGPDRRVRVVVINDRLARAETLAIRVRGVTGAGTLMQLRARSIGAKGDVTLGGQSFGRRTTTGLLAGAARVSSVPSDANGYVVRLPPASAALLTLARR